MLSPQATQVTHAGLWVSRESYANTTPSQDLEEELDDIIADLKLKMETACREDNVAREDDRAAVAKIKLLPEVMTLMNRQNIQHAILDPETNFLQAVKYFLEPLQADGSLPAYNIQREIFTALTRMPVEKEALLSSGIGQVVLFYTKTKRAQPEIKRMAERLMGEWSRPILQRTDDYKKRQIESRYIDPEYVFPHPHHNFDVYMHERHPYTNHSTPQQQRPQIQRPRLPAQPVLTAVPGPPPRSGQQQRQEGELRVREAGGEASCRPRARAQHQPRQARGHARQLHHRAHLAGGQRLRRAGPQARGRGEHGGVSEDHAGQEEEQLDLCFLGLRRFWREAMVVEGVLVCVLRAVGFMVREDLRSAVCMCWGWLQVKRTVQQHEMR